MKTVCFWKLFHNGLNQCNIIHYSPDPNKFICLIKLKLPTIYDKNVYAREHLKQVKLHHNRHFQRNKTNVVWLAICAMITKICKRSLIMHALYQALEYALTPLVIAIAMFCLKMQWTLIHGHKNMDHSTNFDITCITFYAISQSVHVSYINSRSMTFWQNWRNELNTLQLKLACKSRFILWKCFSAMMNKFG